MGSRPSSGETSSVDDDDDIDDDDEDDDDNNDDDDDDIPLAQRIPGALTAQKSIRHEVCQERPSAVPSSSHDTAATSQTAMDRNPRPLTRNNSRSLNPFSREVSLKRRGIYGPDGVEAAATAPVDATSLYQRLDSLRLHRSKSITRSSRDIRPPSTEALPLVPIPQSHPPTSQAQGTKNVKSLPYRFPSPPVSIPRNHPPTSQAQGTKGIKESSSLPYSFPTPPASIPQSHLPGSQAQGTMNVKESSSLPYRFPTSPSPTPINSAYAPSSITPLRHKRSFHFHRPSVDSRPIGMDDPSSVPLPSDAEKRISQNSTGTNINKSGPSTREGPKQQTSTFPTATPTHRHHRSLSRSRGSFERTSPTTIPEPVPIPPIPTTTTRISHSRAHRSALSVSSPADQLPMIKPELVVQQRVFIGNMQRFNMVEISV